MPEHVRRILQAADFAAKAHRDQRRRDAEQSPYINHPLNVAHILSRVGNITDIDLLVAALLHDTVEDTGVTHDELLSEFGESVANLVAEVTDDKSLPKSRRKELQIETAPKKSPGAKQLKLADKISNISQMDASTPAGWDYQRKADYLEWAQKVIAGCRGVNNALEAEFDKTIVATAKKIEE